MVSLITLIEYLLMVCFVIKWLMVCLAMLPECLLKVCVALLVECLFMACLVMIECLFMVC